MGERFCSERAAMDGELGVDSISLDLPYVSVVIRPYRRRELLRMTIQSVLELDYDRRKLEVIIVKSAGDSEVDEGHTEFCTSVGQSLTFRILEIDENVATRAWNLGIKSSKGDLVIVLPDDVKVHPLTVKRALSYFVKDSCVAAVTFPAIPVDIEDMIKIPLPSRLHHLKILGTIRCSNVVSIVTVYRRDMLLEVGAYREDMGPPLSIHEDWELGSRITRRGYRVLIDGTLPQLHLESLNIHPNQCSMLHKGRSVYKLKFLSSIKAYVLSYLNRNWWSMLQVLRVSPITQLAEYFGYGLIPVLLLLLVATPFYAICLSSGVVAASVIISCSRGYYKAFGLKEQVVYPVILLSVRILRTYLFALGFIVNFLK